MSFVENLAVLTVGIVIGLVVSLVILFRKQRPPKPIPVDKLSAWEHLKELAKRKAEVLASKEALAQAYKRGSLDEKTYIEESSKLDSKLESIEKEMEETIYLVGKGLVPDFMVDAQKEVLKLEEAIKLSHAYKKLKEELEKVKSEKDSLLMQINDLEDEKKQLKANYNWLEQNTTKRINELNEELSNLKHLVDKLKSQKRELELRLKDLDKPENEKIKNLRNENSLLREEIKNLKRKLVILDKTVEMLLTIIWRYSDHIKEKETRSVEELKSLVDPECQAVKDLVKTYNTPEKAFEYVRDHILEISPPLGISFWLKADEVLRIGAGDNEDRAFLLCSMIRALGKNAKVLSVETSKGEHRVLVMLEDSGNYYILDLDKERKFNDFVGDSEEDAIRKYITKHGSIKKLRYAVNDKEAKI